MLCVVDFLNFINLNARNLLQRNFKSVKCRLRTNEIKVILNCCRLTNHRKYIGNNKYNNIINARPIYLSFDHYIAIAHRQRKR